MRMETHFHMKDFALSLTLKQSLKATRKWPIILELMHLIIQFDYKSIIFELIYLIMRFDYNSIIVDLIQLIILNTVSLSHSVVT